MPDSYVTIEKFGKTAIVRFDRQANLNAFNQDLILELTDVARRFQEDVPSRQSYYAVLQTPSLQVST